MRIIRIVFKLMILCIFFLTFIGCSKGIDHALETGNGSVKYQKSLNEAVKDMEENELKAFDWAVSDFNLEKLHTVYPNATPKAIIRGEVKKVLNEYPKKITELENLKPKYDAILSEIDKVSIDNVKFSLEKDFFGLQPNIGARVTNNGSLEISKITWHAQLFINGRNEPVAQAKLHDSYKKGLLPNSSEQRNFKVGSLSGDPKWTTLEIQNAKQTKVVLVAIPESVEDFGNRIYLEGAPYSLLNSLKSGIEAAKRYSAI